MFFLKVYKLIKNLSLGTPNLVPALETWINNYIENNLFSISGYNIFRKDHSYRRVVVEVCVYLFIEHIRV